MNSRFYNKKKKKKSKLSTIIPWTPDGNRHLGTQLCMTVISQVCSLNKWKMEMNERNGDKDYRDNNNWIHPIDTLYSWAEEIWMLNFFH